MAETANNKGKNTPKKEEELTFSGFLKRIDPKVYRQVVIFFAIALFVSTVFWVFLRIGQEIFVRSQIKSGTPTTTQDTQTNPTTTQFSYDQQRKNDVYLINSAIDAYHLDNEKPPAALSDLEQKYLGEMPKDPESEKPYQYKVSEDKKGWKVWSLLSDGSMFELEGP